MSRIGFFLALANSRPGMTTYRWGSGYGLMASSVPGGRSSATSTNSHLTILSWTLLGIGGSPGPNHTFCNLAPSPSCLGTNRDISAPVRTDEPIASATWLAIAVAGVVPASVMVDGECGIIPAAEISPKCTAWRGIWGRRHCPLSGSFPTYHSALHPAYLGGVLTVLSHRPLVFTREHHTLVNAYCLVAPWSPPHLPQKHHTHNVFSGTMVTAPSTPRPALHHGGGILFCGTVVTARPALHPGGCLRFSGTLVTAHLSSTPHPGGYCLLVTPWSLNHRGGNHLLSKVDASGKYKYTLYCHYALASCHDPGHCFPPSLLAYICYHSLPIPELAPTSTYFDLLIALLFST